MTGIDGKYLLTSVAHKGHEFGGRKRQRAGEYSNLSYMCLGAYSFDYCELFHVIFILLLTHSYCSLCELCETVFEASTTTTAAQSMASAAPVHTTYVHGAQHHEVHPDDPEYEKIKLDLEKEGLALQRLVKLTHTMLAEMFQTEADHLVKMRPEGDHLL